MKTGIAAACFVLVAAPAWTQGWAQPQGVHEPLGDKPQLQQAKFKDCARRAQGRGGDDRRQFMRSCLRGEQVAAADASASLPQGRGGRMKACSEEAAQRALRGDERRQHMKACLAR